MFLNALDSRLVPVKSLKNNELVIAPAQRAGVSFMASAKAGSRHAILETSYSEPFEFAHLIYESGETSLQSGRDPLTLPAQRNTPKLDLQDPIEANLVMTGGAMGRMMPMRGLIENSKVWAFNGIAGDLDEPLLETTNGRTTLINMTNDTNCPHATIAA